MRARSAGSTREPGFRQPGDDPQRVLMIELPQHGIRQCHSVKLPEGVVVAVVIEVLICRLEYSPEVRIFVRLEAVFPEQDAVLVLHEEVSPETRLAYEIIQDSANLRMQV